MFYHNLKLALRNLTKHKVFSFINISGLTIGIASCVLIGLYVFSEYSFDRFHVHHNNIFRVNKLTNEKGGQANRDGITPGQLAPELEKQLPEVLHATRMRPWFNEMLVKYDTISLKLDDVVYTDASFLKIFDFPIESGNKNTVLSEPYTAVVTESTAKKFFRNDNPIGKTIYTLDNIPVTITGVAKDVPINSSIRFNILISWATVEAQKDYFFWMNNWTTNVVFTFVQTKDNVNIAQLNTKISTILHQHFSETEFQYRPFLQALDDIHLKSADLNYAAQFQTNSNKIIYTLSIIAILILLIACFNFINLTTAATLTRAKETGVQKVLGARQSQLIKKFFGESFVSCLFSVTLGVFIAILLLPAFNDLTGATLYPELILNKKIIYGLLGLLLIVALIAGLYPAIFLSRFKSTDVFRNVINAGKNAWFRKSLVTTQFSISVLLIVATIVVNKQMHFIATRDLGFDKDQMVVIQLANTPIENKSREFANALRKNPGIQSVSISNSVPGQSLNGYGIIPEGHTLSEHLQSNVIETDCNFASVYNLQLSKGRYFSSEMPTDTTQAIVINEAMSRYLGWKNPIGKQFEIYEARKGRVIGEIKDFNFASLREAVQPLAIMLSANPLYMSVKLKSGTVKSSLQYIQDQWKLFDNQYPFDYSFMDEKLNHYYQSDMRLLHALGIFAVLAIFIACMGLLGLSIYSARQRTKEIGIRKVLGASVAGIAGMLSKDFLKPVIIASLIAFPLAWWAMNKWLQDFAYRVHINWTVFVLAGIVAIMIALLTVSFQAIRAAIANPVSSLRSE